MARNANTTQRGEEGGADEKAQSYLSFSGDEAVAFQHREAYPLVRRLILETNSFLQHHILFKAGVHPASYFVMLSLLYSNAVEATIFNSGMLKFAVELNQHMRIFSQNLKAERFCLPKKGLFM